MILNVFKVLIHAYYLKKNCDSFFYLWLLFFYLWPLFAILKMLTDRANLVVVGRMEGNVSVINYEKWNAEFSAYILQLSGSDWTDLLVWMYDVAFESSWKKLRLYFSSVV